jgi:hypothetical protein
MMHVRIQRNICLVFVCQNMPWIQFPHAARYDEFNALQLRIMRLPVMQDSVA